MRRLCGVCSGPGENPGLGKEQHADGASGDYDGYRDMAEEYNVRAIPTIIVLDKGWREVGRFVEMPHRFGTVEEELCSILDSKGGSKS